MAWDRPERARGSIALIGGGAEDDAPGAWSNAIYGWIAGRAGGRRVVVLSVYEESPWLPEYFRRLGASDAANLTVSTREEADRPETYDAIAGAGALFIKGGDQAKYLAAWAGTAAERAMTDLYRAGGVVAGTSAGAHILGSVVYDARKGSVYPEEAIRDAHDRHITFRDDFVGLVPGALVDTHFTARGRIVRLLSMMARLGSGGRDVLGVGLDENTAMLIGPDMKGVVAGEGAVTIVRRTDASRARSSKRRPPVLTDLAYDQLTEGFVFDFGRREVAGVPATAESGFAALPAGPFVAMTLLGSLPGHSAVGVSALENADADPFALLHGALREAPGLGLFGGVVVTAAFADADFIENRTGGLQWALANRPGLVGVLLDRGARAVLDMSGRLAPEAGEREPALLVLDCRRLAHRAYSQWVISKTSAGPRQSVALTGVRAHLLASGWAYDAATGEAVRVSRARPGAARGPAGPLP